MLLSIMVINYIIDVVFGPLGLGGVWRSVKMFDVVTFLCLAYE